MSGHKETGKKEGVDNSAEAPMGLTRTSPAGILAQRVGRRIELVARLLKGAPTTEWLTAELVSLIAGTLRKFDGIECAWCPPGQFVMGSPEAEEGRMEIETQHAVTLAQGFWMSSSPTTQAQYESIMGFNPSQFKGQDHPVEGVKWQDAVDYCRKLTVQHRRNGTLKEGWGWRLPTETEWEYAARAGTLGPRHGELDEIGWYEANSGGETHAVKQKQPNAWGLYDMIGNVWEWCSNSLGDTQVIQNQLDQMGYARLLTPEQLVDNANRIRENENEFKRIIYSLGFSGKEHIFLADKLTSDPPSENFYQVIDHKKTGEREEHLKILRKLIKDLRRIDRQVDAYWCEIQKQKSKTKREKTLVEFKKLGHKLQKSFTKFYYNENIILRMFWVAENVYEKFQTSARCIKELDAQKRSAQAKAIIHAEERKIKALEEFARMSFDEYATAFSRLKVLVEAEKQMHRENRYIWHRVIRGGGWFNTAANARSAQRGSATTWSTSWFGFRPVLSKSENA